MKRFLFVLLFIIPPFIHAQTIKTDVLVIGNGDAAYGAGLQSSKSGVKTIILNQDAAIDGVTVSNGKSKEVKTMYLLVQIKKINSLGLPDENQKHANKKKDPKAKIDSASLFRVLDNTPYTDIKRSGSGWEVKLTKDKSIKAKVLVLANNPDKLISALKITSLKPATLAPLNYKENLYRTTISGVKSDSAAYLSLYNLLIPDQENLLYISANNYEIAAATGATAAYAALFKTKTSLSNLKEIQGKLLSHKKTLMPFEDVNTTDSNWLAIQKIGITGILKAELKNGKAYFNPDAAVTYEEIKQPIKDYYYKAQIWFDDHQNIPVTLENTIALVSYVGNKATDATTTTIEKKWSKNYKFSSKYDLKKVLTRREFSEIITEFLKPFDVVNVDKTGRVVR